VLASGIVAAAAPVEPVAFVGVQLVPMDSDSVQSDVTVLIENG